MWNRSRSGSEAAGDAIELRVRCTAAEAECERLVAEVERTRRQFRNVIERNPDAIIVVDTTGVIRFANARAAELFRKSRDTLTGSQFGFPMVAGETTELDLLDTQRVIEMHVVETEWEGEAACIASLRDVTERRQAEEAARRLIREQAARSAAEAASRRFRFLAEAGRLLAVPFEFGETLKTLARLCVEHMADWAIIYVTDEDGSVYRLEVVHRDPALQDAAAAIRDHPITVDGPHPVLAVLRERRPVLVTDVDEAKLVGLAEDRTHLALMRQLGVSSFILAPLLARGRELGALGLVSSDPRRPFTEDDLAAADELATRAALALDNARLYRAAQEANEAKTNLLAVISHDLRTPLNSIMGHVELLAMGLPEQLSDATLARVERIRLSAAHLVYLIDELLAFARLESGHQELRLQTIDVRAVTRDVAGVVEPLAEKRGLAFEAPLPGEPIRLHTDPGRLHQVLLNLTANAIKYTEQGSVRILLSADADGGARWDVVDTGIGIDGGHLERIFEPFWQVDAQQRAQDGGTGLGLSVVRRLVDMLGGSISVHSEPGRGSTFTVQLPPSTEPPAD